MELSAVTKTGHRIKGVRYPPWQMPPQAITSIGCASFSAQDSGIWSPRLRQMPPELVHGDSERPAIGGRTLKNLVKSANQSGNCFEPLLQKD
jgi:hypothetical protein